MLDAAAMQARAEGTVKPRLGFIGVGGIGRRRMESIVEAGAATAAVICEPDEAAVRDALEVSPTAEFVNSFDQVRLEDLDGLVIATPNALHAEQAIAALGAGVAVFCQKPLGRTAAEVKEVVDAARRADRLLGIDYSYRFIDGVPAMRELIASGSLGKIFAADLVFHNAYGPGRSWFFDKTAAGGGCLIDLGVHLVDMAVWMLGPREVAGVSVILMSNGRRISADAVEDYCSSRVDLDNDQTVRVACSWNLNAGREADISMTFYGTGGAVRLHNVDGSFFDFQVDKLSGTSSETVAATAPGKWEWGSRAAETWLSGLAAGGTYDPACETSIVTAEIIDRIYAAAN